MGLAVFGVLLPVLPATPFVLLFVQDGWLQAALATFGVLLAIWLYRIPSRDRL